MTGWKRWNGELVNPERYARLAAAAGLASEDAALVTPTEPVATKSKRGKKAKMAAEAPPLGGGIVTAADLDAEAVADADTSLIDASAALGSAFTALEGEE